MADYLATYETPGTGAVMQVEVNFAGQRPDLPNDPAPYLDPANVKAMIVTEATSTTVEVVRDITITRVNSTTFRTDEIVPLGTILRVYRITDIEFPIVDFVSLQVVSEADLDLQARQTLYAVMESRDAATRAQVYANFAQSVSVEANASAKDAVEKAEAAVRTADAAALSATNAVQVANQANVKSDEALAAAEAAEEHATNVETLAQSAQEAAAAAQQEATDARLAAENAVDIANGVDGKADRALEAAQRADTNAAQALSVANGIAATAEEARAIANAAKDAADNAVEVAAAVDGKAQTALDTAEAANVSAQNAVLIAQAAVTSANNANGGVTAANGRIDVLAARVLVLEQWRAYTDNVLNTYVPMINSHTTRLNGHDTRLTKIETPNVPTWVHGANGVILALVNGVLWSAMGEGSVYGQVAVGRGGDGGTSSSARFSVENFQRVHIPSTSPVVKAHTDGKQSYALLENGDLYAWGINQYGQLGLGHNAVTGIPTLSSQNVLDMYYDSTNGAYDSNSSKMYIRKAAGIYACGYNAYGQLGTGNTTSLNVWTLTWPIANGTPRLVFNLGATHGVGVIITTDNRMMVCGRNDTGALATGNGSNVLNWTDVTANWGGASAVAQITRMTGGFGHSDSAGYGNAWMAAFAQGLWVRVSGFGGYGAIGNGSLANVTTSNNVALPSLPLDFVVTGDAPGSLFVLGADRNVYAWGYSNTDGQTGLGLTGITPTVQKVALPGAVSKFITRNASAYGYGYASAMVVQLNDGSYWGWGNNRSGGVGTGDGGSVITPRRVLLPAREADDSTMVPVHHVQLAVDQSGVQTNLLFTSAGFIYGWGYNGRSTLFHTTVTSNERVPIRLVPPWRSKV